MKTHLFTYLLLIIACLNLPAQDSNKIETIAIIELLNDELTLLDNDTIPLNSIYGKLNQKLENSVITGNIIPSVTLIVNSTVSENSIENIKYQIKSTQIQLINLQRKTIRNFDGIEVTQNVLDQYNALINYWNNLESSERFYREEDLKFIESVALTMSINQRIRNEKLPGYLPFVKPEPRIPRLTMFEAKPNQFYYYVFEKDTLMKDEALKTHKNKAYRLKKRIINEENAIIVEIQKD